MIHYATCILRTEPLGNALCFKYEAKNAFSKKIGHVNANFRNICKSVAAKIQLHHCATWQSGISTRFKCSSGGTVRVENLEGGLAVQELGLEKTEVFVANEVEIFGTVYRSNLYIVVDVSDDDALVPTFGLI